MDQESASMPTPKSMPPYPRLDTEAYLVARSQLPELALVEALEKAMDQTSNSYDSHLELVKARKALDAACRDLRDRYTYPDAG